MYRDIATMCWSIKEVNKNLGDRAPVGDYSVSYLKGSRSKLASMLKELDSNSPGEEINVVDQEGRTRRFPLGDVALMLSDVKKIVELNLIDHIEEWARQHCQSPGKN